MHHPVTGYCRAAFNTILGHSIYTDFIYQAIGWIVVLAICVGLAKFVQKSTPKLFAILTGGRATAVDSNL